MRLNVQKIKLLLSEKQLSIVEVARAAGKSQSQIGAMIRRGTCSFKSAGALAKALQVNVAEIVIESDL